MTGTYRLDEMSDRLSGQAVTLMRRLRHHRRSPPALSALNTTRESRGTVCTRVDPYLAGLPDPSLSAS